LDPRTLRREAVGDLTGPIGRVVVDDQHHSVAAEDLP
jgi:hypothetical protein